MRKKLSSYLLPALVSFLVIAICVAAIVSASSGNTLLILNWGEYIDEGLLNAFEEEYNCTVSMDLADTNEIFYSKVSGGTTIYDLVVPSDYMVEKMYVQGLLEELDASKLTNYSYDDLRPGVKKIFADMDQNLIDNLDNPSYSYTYDYENYDSTGKLGDYIISNYAIPYLWGTWGMMYSTGVEGLENAVCNNKQNEWAAMFDRNVLPAGTRVAQYESYQHDYAIACKYLAKKQALAGQEVTFNATNELAQSELDTIRNLLKDMNYEAWGTDNIKKDIVAGNIDLGFMWTGDFLYYYAEQCANTVMEAYQDGNVEFEELNSCINALLSVSVDEDGALIKDQDDNVITTGSRTYEANGTTYDIGFDFYIPEDTVAFCDNLIMTKDAVHKDLAYDFLNFITSHDILINQDESDYVIEHSEEATADDYSSPQFIYTYYVDYDAPNIDTYYEITDLQASTNFADSESVCKEDYLDLGSDPYDSDLYWLIYDYAIGVGFQKYYPLNTEKGQILSMFPRKYINSINTTFNNAKI